MLRVIKGSNQNIAVWIMLRLTISDYINSCGMMQRNADTSHDLMKFITCTWL